MLAYSQEMNELQLLKNDDDNDDDDTDYNYDQDSSNNGGRYDIFQTCHHKAYLWNAWINI